MNLYRLADAQTLKGKPIDTSMVTAVLKGLEIAIKDLFGNIPTQTQEFADSLYLQVLSKQCPFVVAGKLFDTKQHPKSRPVVGYPELFVRTLK